MTRALVSLFDQKYQHIVAEATHKSPLAATARHEGQDGALWLCGTSIPRAFGICEHVLNLGSDGPQHEQAELPVSVISNLYKDDRFSGRPYCRSLFYVGVPIRMPSGIDIGVLCVFDDKNRPSLDARSTQVLRDLSRTIMDHLVSRRASVRSDRA